MTATKTVQWMKQSEKSFTNTNAFNACIIHTCTDLFNYLALYVFRLSPTKHPPCISCFSSFYNRVNGILSNTLEYNFYRQSHVPTQISKTK